MSKIQILKAIHNLADALTIDVKAVSDVKDTNFESNSQPGTFNIIGNFAVSDVKDTNFESNSQPQERN